MNDRRLDETTDDARLTSRTIVERRKRNSRVTRRLFLTYAILGAVAALAASLSSFVDYFQTSDPNFRQLQSLFTIVSVMVAISSLAGYAIFNESRSRQERLNGLEFAVGRLLIEWSALERLITELSSNNEGSFRESLGMLVSSSRLDVDDAIEMQQYYEIRNKVVHGREEYSPELLMRVAEDISAMKRRVLRDRLGVES